MQALKYCCAVTDFLKDIKGFSIKETAKQKRLILLQPLQKSDIAYLAVKLNFFRQANFNVNGNTQQYQLIHFIKEMCINNFR